MNKEISRLCAGLAKIIVTESEASEASVTLELERKVTENYRQYLVDEDDLEVVIRALHFLSQMQYFTREKPSVAVYISMLDLLIGIVFPMVALEGKADDFLDNIIRAVEVMKKGRK